MPLDPISARVATTPLLPAGTGATDPAQASAGSFANALKNLVDSVDETAGDANEAVVNMVTGKGDVHHAMIAMQRADMMLQLTVQIRNKLVQAYQDVMRMPV